MGVTGISVSKKALAKAKNGDCGRDLDPEFACVSGLAERLLGVDELALGINWLGCLRIGSVEPVLDRRRLEEVENWQKRNLARKLD
ncbi:conserved hypothetical protein [Uncinocarpus reesii 1704]|uniref:Uncharacterized protein n=1 Tax=Uncinocarpus reesii (strain UAMH 1704) TaxID=336963 RepID=C4JKW1_UNCRE|nr:uncharacterized protein UREG_00194 [Uncinocarpus reesii 1704]EEP75348.1 conserved hypothetical protein [Uncinocarpus reesii 1704]